MKCLTLNGTQKLFKTNLHESKFMITCFAFYERVTSVVGW